MNRSCGPMAILRLGISKACDCLRGHHWHHWKLASFQQTHSIAKRHRKQKLHGNPPRTKNPQLFFHIGQRANNPGITSRRTRNPGGSTWTAESCCWHDVWWGKIAKPHNKLAPHASHADCLRLKNRQVFGEWKIPLPNGGKMAGNWDYALPLPKVKAASKCSSLWFFFCLLRCPGRQRC